MDTYFLFYSHIHINCSKQKALIFNSETRESIITHNMTFVKVFEEISLPTIYYMIHITDELYKDSVFKNLLQNLETLFYGETIHRLESNKPIQFSPHVVIKNNPPLETEYLSSFDFSNNDFITKAVLDDLGNDILTHVLEFSIYYSTLLNESCSFYNMTYNQYLFPVVSNTKIKMRELDSIFNYIYPRLCKINLIIGELDNDDIEYIKMCIQKNSLKGKIVLYIAGEICKNVTEDFSELFEIIYVWNSRKEVSCKIFKNQSNLSLAENETDLQIFENSSHVDEVFPLYNGSNLDFVKKYLSFTQKEILENHICEREIFMNKYINSNFYGELSIYPNGDVLSRKNCAPLGNIKKLDMKRMVLSEFCNHRNWFLTRNRMLVCKDCILNWLCPPITYNELEIMNWTLCEN